MRLKYANILIPILKKNATECVGCVATDNSRYWQLLSSDAPYHTIKGVCYPDLVLAVRQKLNEILRVRHSFAHGFAIPALSWTQTATGKVRLTAKAIDDVDVFFTHLVNVTDLGMKQHIETSYSLVLPW